MKALKCEMCGSNDIVKQEDLFVCQNCGTKYSVEAARKMMIEGTVEVKGTVKIDDSEELKKLYDAARSAKETDNWVTGKKYYDQILEKEPDSWEANFYSVYFKVRESMEKNRFELVQEVNKLKNSLDFIMVLVKDKVYEGNDMQRPVSEIFSKCKYIAETVGQFNPSSGAALMFFLGDAIESKIGSSGVGLALSAWKCGVQVDNKLLLSGGAGVQMDERKTIKSYSEKIKKYDNSYIIPESRVGCYIASAVYGSYNCPEVWTLRRFRDNTLDETWYGRAFIKTYYAISPTLVKWFGETSWFKRFWRRPLDKLVASLRSKGVEDSPYQDKY